MKKIPGNVSIKKAEDGTQHIEICLTQQDILVMMENFAVHLLGEGNMEPDEVKDILVNMTGEQSVLTDLIEEAVKNAEKITERPITPSLS